MIINPSYDQVDTNLFIGLNAYSESDAQQFYGRSIETLRT